MSYVNDSLVEAQMALTKFINDAEQIANVDHAINRLVSSLRTGGHIFSCGNGGSMCDAMHFAEELTGRYRKDRSPLAGVAISDPSHMSCIGNDYGYVEIFERYLQAHARQGDCLVAMTTSGTSKNVLKAVKTAKDMGLKVIVLTGRYNDDLQNMTDVCIVAKAGQWADRVQEMHIKILHIFIEGIERNLFPENYQ